MVGRGTRCRRITAERTVVCKLAGSFDPFKGKLGFMRIPAKLLKGKRFTRREGLGDGFDAIFVGLLGMGQRDRAAHQSGQRWRSGARVPAPDLC
jgi:hypothetical protein